jgi:hypothetical protein
MLFACVRFARRSRLFQFVLLGSLLFLLDRRRRQDLPAVAHNNVVDIDEAALKELRSAQAQKLGLAALPEQGRREVDARAIEDEILYKEALRLGLDKDDPIIRQRLVQKLLLLVEDMGGASRDPTRDELRAYFDSTSTGGRERWRRPTTWHFIHAFAREANALPSPDQLAAFSSAPNLGEPFPYPRDMTLTRDAIERLLGSPFTSATTSLTTHGISDAVRSPFGWHRIKLLERIEGAPATFEEVEKSIAIDFLLDRRERVVGTYLQQTCAAYDVRISGTPVTNFVPTRRVAARNEGSAED